MSLTVDTQTIPLTADRDDVMRVGKTRVTLDTIVRAFEQGHTAEEIASHYPALRLADVYSVISYYLNNQESVESYLNQQQVEELQIWERIEADDTYQSFRRRLLNRHEVKDNPTAS